MTSIQRQQIYGTRNPICTERTKLLTLMPQQPQRNLPGTHLACETKTCGLIYNYTKQIKRSTQDIRQLRHDIFVINPNSI